MLVAEQRYFETRPYHAGPGTVLSPASCDGKRRLTRQQETLGGGLLLGTTSSMYTFILRPRLVMK